MENPTLHTQKVAILSRLVKESSLTLEEALLLLKEEEQEVVQESVQQPLWQWNPGTTTPYIQPYTHGTGNFPLSGTVTVPTNGLTINTTGISTTAAFTPSSTFTADLNN